MALPLCGSAATDDEAIAYSRHMSRTVVAVALALLVVVAAPQAQSPTTQPIDPARWERDIRAFESADGVARPPTGGIVLTGSSSIRLWTSLSSDFPGMPVLNRGFGGSQLRDVTAFVDRIVTPYQPRQVVVYCGGNDINAGRTPGQMLTDYQALVRAIHAGTPDAQLAYISIAPNPARWSQRDTVKAANDLIEAWTRTNPRLSFIDVYAAMLGPDGQPRPDIFVADRLHMNPNGYAIWRAIVGPHLR